MTRTWTSLMVQWVRLCFPLQWAGSIPGQGTKIPHALLQGQNKIKTLTFILNFLVLMAVDAGANS